MEKFQLSAIAEISGIGSASGIVYKDNSLFIISDNSGFLYQYNLSKNVTLSAVERLQKHPLIENPSENILKKQKPDFEAVTLKGNELHLFGSGSTENRNKSIVFNTNSHQVIENDFSEIYQKIKTNFDISDDELNIEGALFYNKNLYLFQRGNGGNSKNGIAIVNGTNPIQFVAVSLPKIKHVEATFTDAILVEDKIYFLASAEDTISTYEDGEVLGSSIGCMNIETFHIDFTHQISNKHKFEGLTLLEKAENEITFLLCEDNDTEDLNTTIYKLSLKI